MQPGSKALVQCLEETFCLRKAGKIFIYAEHGTGQFDAMRWASGYRLFLATKAIFICER